MSSLITTDLEVDPAVEMTSGWRFDTADRRYVDDQIRGCQQHLVDALINGRHATWVHLSGSSAAVIAGDTVCSESLSTGTVTKSTGAMLANARAVLGVVIYAASPGGMVLVAFGGQVPPTITGLAASSPGYVRVNTSTSRCEYVASISGADYPVGVVDNAGWLQFIPAVSPVFTLNDPTITGTVTYQGTKLRILSIPGEAVTTTASSVVVATFTMLDNTCCTFDFIVGMSKQTTLDKAGRWDGKATYRRAGGAPTIVGAAEYGTPHLTTAGDDVVFDVSGNAVRVYATAIDADDRNWTCELRVHETLSTV